MVSLDPCFLVVELISSARIDLTWSPLKMLEKGMHMRRKVLECCSYCLWLKVCWLHKCSWSLENGSSSTSFISCWKLKGGFWELGASGATQEVGSMESLKKAQAAIDSLCCWWGCFLGAHVLEGNSMFVANLDAVISCWDEVLERYLYCFWHAVFWLKVYWLHKWFWSSESWNS